MLQGLVAFTSACTLDAAGGFELRRRLEDGAPEWVYTRTAHASSSAQDQRATWPLACSEGMKQSPINVRSSQAVPTPALDDAVAVHITKHIPLLVNTGHYFELDQTSPTHSIRRSGEAAPHPTEASKGWTRVLGASYNFYQVHWHSPSENTIDGERFAMEAHFVHQLNDSSLVGTNAKLAVIAVMYELRKECNPDLDEFWSQLPMAPGDAPFDSPVDIGSWLGSRMLSGGYYHWKGSLTTPPCTEGVTWLLLRNRSHVCSRQLERLRTSLGSMQHGVDVNNRVVQPLNGRRIQVTTTPWRPPSTTTITSSSFSGTPSGASPDLSPSELAPYVLGGMATTLLILWLVELLGRSSRSRSRPRGGGRDADGYAMEVV